MDRRVHAGAVDVRRVVALLVAVDLLQRRAHLDAVRMGQHQHLLGIVHPRLEHVADELGASLQDAHEGEPAVTEGRGDDLEQDLRNPVDCLRDERHVLHAERDRERVQCIEERAARCRVALRSLRRGRRGLLLRQAVDVIVVQQHGHVHVVADRVEPVRGADAATVAVAGVDEDVQIGTGELDALGDRQRTAVNAVEAVGAHVMRQAARAADSRDEDGLLRLEALVTAQALDGGKDGVVAAALAPAWHATLVVLECVVLREEALQAERGGTHGRVSSRAMRRRITSQIVPGLIGRPRTSLQQSTSTR